MRNRSCIDLIDYYKSVVYLSIYRGGGLDPLQTNFRAFPAILANNRGTKLGTLICSALARIVRPTGVDRPDRRPSGPGPDRPPFSFWCRTYAPCLLVELSEPKATNSMYHIGFLRHLATY
jgi:hypothetical protein